MAAKSSTPNRSESFGRLLSGMVSSIAAYEGKTSAVVEEELGAALAVAGKTVQRYKAGYLPPTDEAVRLLAEAAVRRGFLGREWLQRFLHAARYPGADRLLDELCPVPQVRPRPPRVYENLPAPTYSQFVMREQAFAELLDGLQQRSAAVLVLGLGGNGKTSLAREVAAHCLRAVEGAPRFDAVVWVSDKDRPGTTNLSVVLDEVARTLDYPGFTQFADDEKRREVEQLLRRQRVLLVVDNFETITDSALLTWLLRLPEPSKAIITSREYRREWRSSWPVELRGMREGEAWALISERARVLKIDRLVGERAQLEPLLAATGGNPKALSMTLGLLKYERRPLQAIVDDLYAARGDLFDDLFVRAWALLDEAARRILLVATFFPTSASGDALRASADVQGFAFDRAVERLADMALLDVQQTDLNSPPRYALHPLVRAFAGVRLAEQPGFEEG
ncbi:MAG: NB-ARC domain-containing protein, partial [Chloroflexales bacterium]